MTTELQLNQSKNSEMFWSAVKMSRPETVVVNERDVLGKDVNVCVVLCPLYAPGDLDKAGLIKPPLSIEDSRVANKFAAYIDILHCLGGFIQAFGGEVNLHAIFANKGVLFPGNPAVDDIGALKYHSQLYSGAFYTFARENHMNLFWSDYDDWNVSFHKFVDLKNALPQSVCRLDEKNLPNLESKMIDQLNYYLGTNITATRKNRHVIEGILSMNGMTYNSAFWLIAGYLAFDHNIPNIVGSEGIYVTSERLTPLFGIARLTEGLKQMTRIQIKA